MFIESLVGFSSNKAVFTYRALNNLTPEYISTLLKQVSTAYDQLITDHCMYQNHLLFHTTDRSLVQRLGYGTIFLRQLENLTKKNIKAQLLH